jgi:hypothetical protein
MFSAKKSRRSEKCLNCEYPQGLEADYCPNCGQKNEDVNVPMTILLGEFISTYLAIDSKLLKSIWPFILKPGFLTNRYNEGKRMSYSNPLRLYVVTSIIYFFIISFFFSSSIEQFVSAALNKNFSIVPSGADFTMETLQLIQSNKGKMTDEELKEKIPEEILSFYPKDISFDSLLTLMATDPVHLDEEGRMKYQDTTLKKLRERPLMEIVRDPGIDEDAWLQYLSLDGEHIGESTRLIGLKIRKMLDNEAYFINYVFKNLPIMMLLAIPIFAGLLKLLYIRRKRYYIEHVIHALHLHSFGYLLFSLGIFATYNLNFSEGTNILVIIGAFFWVTIYAFLSFRRVYGQRFLKTVIKFWLLGWVYVTLLLLLLLAELYLSVLSF